MAKINKRGLRHYSSELAVFLTHAYREWKADGTHRLGASLAYYGTVAVFPYLAFIIILATVFFTPQEIAQTVTDFVQQLFGRSLDSSILTTGKLPDQFNTLGLVGLVSFVLTATLSIIAIQDAINVIWKVKRHTRFVISRYLLAFVVVLGGAATFTATVGVRVVLSALRDSFASDAFVVSTLFATVATLAFMLLLTIFFVLLYRLLIKVRVDKSSLLISSLITTVFLLLGELGLSVYLTHFVNFSYLGAIGAYFVLLVTVYYVSQIFLIGAQTGKVLSYRHGNEYLQPLLRQTDPRFKPPAKKS